jgi:hypothetical protein
MTFRALVALACLAAAASRAEALRFSPSSSSSSESFGAWLLRGSERASDWIVTTSGIAVLSAAPPAATALPPAPPAALPPALPPGAPWPGLPPPARAASYSFDYYDYAPRPPAGPPPDARPPGVPTRASSEDKEDARLDCSRLAAAMEVASSRAHRADVASDAETGRRAMGKLLHELVFAYAAMGC